MNNENYDPLGLRGHVRGIRTDALAIQCALTVDAGVDPEDLKPFLLDLFRHIDALERLIHGKPAGRRTTRPQPGPCPRCGWRDWIKSRGSFECDICGLVVAPMADHV